MRAFKLPIRRTGLDEVRNRRSLLCIVKVLTFCKGAGYACQTSSGSVRAQVGVELWELYNGLLSKSR